MPIASSATVDPKARIGRDVDIGPGCFIGPEVTLGDGCRLWPNVTIVGSTTIGRRNTFFPGSVIGTPPQDLKYSGEQTQLTIGDENIFRECTTVNLGTEIGGGLTRIGNHNQFQISSHIAHDVTVGDHCVLSNCVQVAGHVVIEDHVTISGLVGIHQFVTIGRYSFIAALARCTMDVPPFLICGLDGIVTGVNVKGLARWGFDEAQTDRLKRIYRQLYPRRGRENESTSLRNFYSLIFSRRARRSILSLARRIQDVEQIGDLDEHCRELVDFIKRSFENNIHGRHLETKRRDGNLPPAQFFAGTSATQAAAAPGTAT